MTATVTVSERIISLRADMDFNYNCIPTSAALPGAALLTSSCRPHPRSPRRRMQELNNIHTYEQGLRSSFTVKCSYVVNRFTKPVVSC